MVTTTLQVPVALRDRLLRAKTHPRQAYHEVVTRALDALDIAASNQPLAGPGAPDPLVARHRKQILATARRWKAKRVWLFGSRAAGGARPGSDVDLLVEFEATASLFDQAGLQGELEELLGVAVDTVSIGGLHGELRRRALAGRVPV